MTQTSLDFLSTPRTVTASSLAAFADITPDLPLRDLLIVASVDDYCRAKGYPDVTGRELAEWLRRDVLSVRPRLTCAKAAGWLTVHRARKSRDLREKSCEPYALAVPRAAVDRAIAVARASQKSAKTTGKSVDFSSEEQRDGGIVVGTGKGAINALPSP
jgi:hypothetical protein